MENPIPAFVRSLLAGLDEGTRSAVAETVREHSTTAIGTELSVESELSLLLIAKTVASADGLSTAELEGMKRLMAQFKLPEVAQNQLLSFDVSAVRAEHVRELVKPKSKDALYLLSAVVTFAALDGLSDEEIAKAMEIGAQLELSPEVCHLIMAEARVTTVALRRGDEEMLRAIRPLRHAMFKAL
jgi:hypothetical protein